MSARKLSNWLEGFMLYTKESECPDSYLLWTGLHTLSATLQRHVWTSWVYHKIFPNIYVMLVGPAGVVHKSSAIRFGRELLKDVKVPIASEAVSKEAFITQMKSRGGDTQSLSITASEFATFIRTSGHSMVEFLTDIYDCEENFEYTTKSGGTVRVELPYLSMIAGAIPDWMATEFDTTFIQGGFAARTVFVMEEAPRFRKAFAYVTPEMRALREALVHDLENISQNLHGEFTWSDEAREFFRSWYEEEWPKEHVDYRVQTFVNRKPTHLLRLSMLLSVSERDDLILEASHFREAIRLLTELQPNMIKAFSAVGKNPFANDLERILSQIQNGGEKGVSKGDIISHNYHAIPNKQTMDEILENLVLMGKVSTKAKGTKQWFFPA